MTTATATTAVTEMPMPITTTAIDARFFTAAQIALDDVASIAALGFKTLINCRPDGEADAAMQQPSSADIAALAQQYGLRYAYFPVVSGTSGDEYAAQMAATLNDTPLPILSFCRSGTRAGKLYALAQAAINTTETVTTETAINSESTHAEKNMGIFKLTAFESRVLGVLLEKRFLTPDTYPLSLNSLTLGCNQLTAREPIMALSETAVKDTLDLLQERKLIAPRQQAGARVIKYEHRLYQHANLDDEMLAVLCVLLLRGEQTLGEMKQRTDRMVGFADLPAVQAAIERLGDLRTPYVLALPKAPGTKEVRYVECLSDDEGRTYAVGSAMMGADHANTATNTSTNTNINSMAAGKGRLGELEDEVSRLKRDLESLTNAFLDFKKSFD